MYQRTIISLFRIRLLFNSLHLASLFLSSKSSIFYLILFLSSLPLTAQNHTRITPVRDTVRIDSLSLVPGSWRVRDLSGKEVPDSLFRIDWAEGLWIRTGLPEALPDTLMVIYDRFPINLNRVYRHKTYSFSSEGNPVYRPPFAGSMGNREDRAGPGTLRSSGSLSRGIAAGSQRDASLTSNLNLQLEGNLNRDFRIEATLTDSNIPVQPDGSTQQLQDFDRVFLRIYNARNEILAGDFDMQPRQGYFLQMNKRVQGARFTTETEAREGKTTFRTRTGAAVVKGKYARNTFNGSEGNQGPYPLKGNAGENYIQIIAGSEKVFIDGRPLTRGEEADYVVDYNTAEIRFTPKNLITKDKRIAVEFEYTERSYARFLAFSENQWKTDGGTYYVSLFSEQDAKNQPLLQDLTEASRRVLADAGDNPDLARVPAIMPTVFRSDRILYKMADTVVNGVRYDSILMYSLNPDSARFEAGFTFVGEGRGHYRQTRSAANGRVFEWVAPVNGVLQGNHEPVSRLAVPVSKQVVTAGLEQRIGRRTLLTGEWALTRNDRNTASDLDDSDNLGMGILTGLQRTDTLSGRRDVRVESLLKYRFTGGAFDPVERYREVEFERDWNLTTGTAEPEHLIELGTRVLSQDSASGSYRMQMLRRGSGYSGFRQYTEGRVLGRKWEGGWTGSYLVTSSGLQDTRFLRHQAYYRRKVGKVSLEVSENAENNRWRDPAGDSLLEASRGFQEFRFEAGERRGERQPWVVRLSERTDLLPSDGRLKPAGRAMEAESWIDLSHQPKFPLKAGVHFRTYNPDSTFTPAQETGNSLTARLDNRLKALKGAIQSQTFIELGTGSDRKPEYAYLQVPNGQGYYTWNDYNSNGVQELNEFETAYFRDQAEYIRVFRLGTERIPTFITRFNQTLTLQPKKGFPAKFTSQTALRIEQKTPVGNSAPQNPLNALNSLRHSLSFNRSHPRFSADLVTTGQSNLTTLLNGAESKRYLTNQLLIRYRFLPSWQLNSTTEIGSRSQESEYFPSRNFNLSSLSQLVRLEYVTPSRIRLGMDNEIRSENNLTDNTRIFTVRSESSITAEIPEKGQISGTLQYVYIQFDGNASSPAGYSMLRGLQNGHNGILQISARYKIGKNLILEGVYEGRIAGSGKPVHNAQLQLRAQF